MPSKCFQSGSRLWWLRYVQKFVDCYNLGCSMFELYTLGGGLPTIYVKKIINLTCDLGGSRWTWIHVLSKFYRHPVWALCCILIVSKLFYWWISWNYCLVVCRPLVHSGMPSTREVPNMTSIIGFHLIWIWSPHGNWSVYRVSGYGSS